MVVTERLAASHAADTVHAVMVHVQDVDAHHARALACGAKVIRGPEDFPYGERQYAVEDTAGYSRNRSLTWTRATGVARCYLFPELEIV